mmetsp:Transcript_1218/g.3207  ORF Transcript_1218/g.3207 Transcript_1218/m.3207 type:complete len:246 (+) Transcript_1218:998-1735(+)
MARDPGAALVVLPAHGGGQVRGAPHRGGPAGGAVPLRLPRPALPLQGLPAQAATAAARRGRPGADPHQEPQGPVRLDLRAAQRLQPGAGQAPVRLQPVQAGPHLPQGLRGVQAGPQDRGNLRRHGRHLERGAVGQGPGRLPRHQEPGRDVEEGGAGGAADQGHGLQHPAGQEGEEDPRGYPREGDHRGGGDPEPRGEAGARPQARVQGAPPGARLSPFGRGGAGGERRRCGAGGLPPKAICGVPV